MSTFGRWTAILLMGMLCLFQTAHVQADQANDEYALSVGLFKQQRYELAEEAFKKFIETFPEDSKVQTARLYRGQALINLAKYEPARVVLREYIKASPLLTENTNDKNLLQAMYRVAECSYLLTDYKDAETEFATWLKHAGDDPLLEWGLPYYGDSLLRNGKANEAIEVFQKSLSKYPNGKLADDSRFGLAKSYEATRQFDKAAQIYEQIADEENQPRAPQALIKLAILAYDQKEFAKSIEVFDRFLKRFPNDSYVSYAWLNRAQACYSMANYKEAASSFEKAKSAPEYSTNATFWQGMSEQMLGNYPAALKHFTEVSLTDEQRQGNLGGELAYQTALALAMTGQLEPALEKWQQLIEDIPTHSRADDALIRSLDLLVNKDQWDNAQKLLEIYKKQFAQSEWKYAAIVLEAKLIIGKATQIEDTNPEQARQQFLQAASLLNKTDFASADDQTRLLARYQTARAYHKAGDYQAALDLLEPMLSIEENKKSFPEALAVLSISYLALKNNEAAVKAAQGYLSSSSQARKDPATQAQMLATLSIAQSRLGNEQAAKTSFASLEKLDVPASLKSKLFLQLAEEAYQQKQFSLAEQIYEKITAFGSDTPYYFSALWGSAWSAYEQQSFEQASQRFLKLSKSNDQKPEAIAEAYHMAGISLQKAGQLPLATKTFMDGYAPYKTEDFDKLPDSLVVQIYRCSKEAARALRLQEQIEPADQAYQIAVASLKSLSPEEQVNLDKLYDEWALLHYEAGDYAKADELYETLLKECPTSSRSDDALLVLAESDFINGQLDRSRKRFEDLVARNDADDLVRKRAAYQLVMLSTGQKNWQDVITKADAYLTGISPSGSPDLTSDLLLKDRETLDVVYQKAKALVETDQLGPAQKLLSNLRTTLKPSLPALKGQPLEDPVASIWLLSAECARRQKQYADVFTLVNEIDRSFPDSLLRADAHVIAGRTDIAQAKFNEAHQNFEQAQKILDNVKNETAVQSHFYQAETYLLQRKTKEALASYMRVYLLYPGFDEWQSAALFQTAQCDEVLQNINSALDSYRRLLEEFPNSLEAPKAQDRLSKLSASN